MSHTYLLSAVQQTWEESLTCEFKGVRHSPVMHIAGKVDEYLVAYVNEVSGSVYWDS
jgi:hypothetical protein